MAISLFRPMDHQEPFFVKFAGEVLLRGGNRAGKSMCAAVKFASTAMDLPVTMNDGTQIDQRRPHQKGRPLVMWVIGYDLQHIGQTIYRLLFKKGLFKIIKDKETGLYRSYREWDPVDSSRSEEAVLSPPLIPPTYVKPDSWVWENKKAKEFKKVEIVNPVTGDLLAEIYAYSSKADPKAGDPVDVIWIDEAIEHPDDYGEWQARLIDRGGFLFWSSWPKTDNDALQKLTSRAQEEKDKEKPLVREFLIALSQNKALSEDARAEALGRFSTEDERMARDRGEYVTGKFRMYPTFDPFFHQAIYETHGDRLSDVLRESNGIPPVTWTHELILDPGTQSPGVLFGAIPPPEYGNHYVVYDEITMRADADALAAEIKKRSGITLWHRFLIDARAAGSHGMGYRMSVADNYSSAFARLGIKCYMTGTGFSLACTDVGARIGELNHWMNRGPNGRPKLRIVRERCPQLCEQLKKYMKARVNNEVKDDRPASGQTIDLAVCYDRETEVLTSEGWKKFEDLVACDSLATFNMNNETMEFQLPSRLYKRWYDGDMVRINSRRLDVMVTPNHRMVVRTQAGKLTTVLAKDLKKTHSIPLAAENGFVGGKRPVVVIPRIYGAMRQVDEIKDVPAFAELIGWFLSEGCCTKYRKVGRGYQVCISQHKEEGVAALEECLSKNPFHYTKDGCNYLISHKQLWHYLKPLGGVYDKAIPRWIKESDAEVMEAFLKGYIAGDGWVRSDDGRIGSVSVSKQLSDEIQELHLKLGRCARVDDRAATATVKADGSLIVGTRPTHVVSVSQKCKQALLYNRKGEQSGCKSLIETERYSGNVYCASVPNGTLVVRRNGKPFISGNCLEYAAASYPEYVVHDKISKAILKVATDGWRHALFGSRVPKQKERSVICGPIT